ncbi:hypothetical protein [Desulfovibrio oxyclinae]|uniref:hypothetical protein n=1 Tax=Desulfovibrio oxyclinae TaxID=63560 RepID=UPI00037DDC0A|nr:hypothetical protein [Desulfovibrio oxyclinae]
MWRYPDNTFRQTPPAQVVQGGSVRRFADLTREERAALGYHEARTLRREPFTSYVTEWLLGEDLILREQIVEAVVDEAARLDDAAERKRREILAGADAAMDAATVEYSRAEIDSWPKQEAEAQALLADSTAPAPVLSGIAAKRGITLAQMRDKVLANVEAFELVCAEILGTQQAAEEQLKAAMDAGNYNAIEALVVEYPEP